MSHGFGDGLVGHAFEVGEDQGGPLSVGKRVDGLPDDAFPVRLLQVVLGAPAPAPVRRRLVGPLVPEVQGQPLQPLFPAPDVEALVYRDPIEPGARVGVPPNRS